MGAGVLMSRPGGSYEMEWRGSGFTYIKRREKSILWNVADLDHTPKVEF